MFQGQRFLHCCEAADYEVTVGGVKCPINSVVHNAMSCDPSQDEPPESHFDRDGCRRVMASLSVQSLPPSAAAKLSIGSRGYL